MLLYSRLLPENHTDKRRIIFLLNSSPPSCNLLLTEIAEKWEEKILLYNLKILFITIGIENFSAADSFFTE